MKRNSLCFLACFMALIILNLTLVCSFFFTLGKNFESKQSIASAKDSGKILVQVLEANTNKAIDSATVCIIETRHYENTDKYGTTKYIEVPIIRNTNYDISLERTWGELTILVYKNGYADNLSFYRSVMPGSLRVGIIIFLNPIISEEDNKPNISMENPNRVWVESLIKLYKKRI